MSRILPVMIAICAVSPFALPICASEETSDSMVISNKVQTKTELKQHNVSLQCGGTVVTIICGKSTDSKAPGDSRQCNDNKLMFKTATGDAFTVEPPKNFDRRKTPVAMSCDIGKKDGKYYVVVELNNGPRDCVPCLTYHLFDLSGRRLTEDKTDSMTQLGQITKKVGGFVYGKSVRIDEVSK